MANEKDAGQLYAEQINKAQADLEAANPPPEPEPKPTKAAKAAKA
jgi:hypothetical protein